MTNKKLDDLIREIERTLLPIADRQRRCFMKKTGF